MIPISQNCDCPSRALLSHQLHNHWGTENNDNTSLKSIASTTNWASVRTQLGLLLQHRPSNTLSASAASTDSTLSTNLQPASAFRMTPPPSSVFNNQPSPVLCDCISTAASVHKTEVDSGHLICIYGLGILCAITFCISLYQSILLSAKKGTCTIHPSSCCAGHQAII